MLAALSATARWWRPLAWMASGAGLTVAGALALLFVVLLAGMPISRSTGALCDRAVATMLESHDLVELQRADMLIRHLNCAVRRRLPREEKP